MSKKRKQHPPEFKAKVALAALKNERKLGTAPVFPVPSLLNGEAGDALQSTYRPPCFSPCPSLFLAYTLSIKKQFLIKS